MKQKIKKIGIIILVLIIAWIFLRLHGLNKTMMFFNAHQGLEIMELKQDLSMLKTKMELLNTKMNRIALGNEPASVDLTSKNVQKINESFTVSIDEVEPHLTGIKIRGEIINTSGLTHRNIKFDVTVAEQTKELHILEEIKSGYSRNFDLYIPDVPIEKSKYAKIEYISFVMRWHSH